MFFVKVWRNVVLNYLSLGSNASCLMHRFGAPVSPSRLRGSPGKSSLARQGSMSKLHGPRSYDEAVTGSPRKTPKHVMFDRQDEVIQYDQISPELVDETWSSLGESGLISCDSDDDLDTSLPPHGPPDSLPQIRRGYRPLPKLPPFILPKVDEKEQSGNTSDMSDNVPVIGEEAEELSSPSHNELQNQLSNSRLSMESRVNAVLDQPTGFKPGQNRYPGRNDSFSSIESQNSVIESLGKNSSPGQSSVEFDATDEEPDVYGVATELQRQESLLGSERLPATEKMSDSSLPIPKSESQRSFVDRRNALLDMLNVNSNNASDSTSLTPSPSTPSLNNENRGPDISIDLPMSVFDYAENGSYMLNPSRDSSPPPVASDLSDKGLSGSESRDMKGVSSEKAENALVQDIKNHEKPADQTRVGPIDGRWPIPELEAVLSPALEQSNWGYPGDTKISIKQENVIGASVEDPESTNTGNNAVRQNDFQSENDHVVFENSSLSGNAAITDSQRNVGLNSQDIFIDTDRNEDHGETPTEAQPNNADLGTSQVEKPLKPDTGMSLHDQLPNSGIRRQHQLPDDITPTHFDSLVDKSSALTSPNVEQRSKVNQSERSVESPSTSSPLETGAIGHSKEEISPYVAEQIPTPNLPLPSTSPFTVDTMKSPEEPRSREVPVEKSPSLDIMRETAMPLLDSDLSDLEAQPDFDSGVDSATHIDENLLRETVNYGESFPEPPTMGSSETSHAESPMISDSVDGDVPMLTGTEEREEAVPPEQELDSELTSPSPIDHITRDNENGYPAETTEIENTNSTLASLPQISGPRALPVPRSSRASTTSLFTAASTLTQSSLDIGEVGDSINSINTDIERMWPSSTNDQGSYQLHESSSMVVAAALPHVHTSTAIHPLHDDGVAPSPREFAPYSMQKESTVRSLADEYARTVPNMVQPEQTQGTTRQANLETWMKNNYADPQLRNPNGSTSRLAPKSFPDDVRASTQPAKQRLRGPRVIPTFLDPLDKDDSVMPAEKSNITKEGDLHSSPEVEVAQRDITNDTGKIEGKNKAFEHYLDKRRSQLPRSDEKGKLLMRLRSIRDLKLKGSAPSVTLTFDTGAHCVTSPPFQANTPISHEYEVSVLPFTNDITILARVHPFPKVNGSWRESVACDGSFARGSLNLNAICREGRGILHSKSIELINEWEDNRQGCIIDLELMWIPRISSNECLPRSLDVANEMVRKAKASNEPLKEGYLYQLGGDCRKWKRRRFVLDSSALIAQSTSQYHRPRALFNLEKAKTVVQKGSIVVLGFQKDRKLELKALDDENAAEWTLAVSQVLQRPLNRPKWLSGLLYS